MLAALAPTVMLGFAIALVPMFGQTTKAADTSRKMVPRFEDFRVPSPIPLRNEPAYVANRVPDPEKEIIEAAKEGPDFAGDFVVERFTCGSGCTSFVIVNVKTLKIFSGKFQVADSFCPESRERGTELEYTIDSRLLIVNGAIETASRKRGQVDGPCGRFYYLWDGRSLKKIHAVVPSAQTVPH